MIMKTAVVQMQGRGLDAQASRVRTLELINSAVLAGARLVVLPELAVPGYCLDADSLRAAAEPLRGSTYMAWAEIAAREKIWIVGGFCEIENGRLYNAAILVGPEGLLGHYRKLHLFDTEKLIFEPGDAGLKVFETPIGRIGLCVCYDLRFVEVARLLALQGADIIAVPTAWVGGFDRNPRDMMGYISQARGVILQANLNQVFIACASQCGVTATNRFLGSSLVADPYGETIVKPMDDVEEGIAVVALDLAMVEQAKVRTEFVRPRDDRRTDVYTLAIAGKHY